MALTNTQREVTEYLNANDYIAPDIVESFGQRLDQERNRKTLKNALKEFVSDKCPNCGVTGLYKWHFLGQLKHPECGQSWYVSNSAYAKRWAKANILISGDAFLSSTQGCFTNILVSLVFLIIGIPLLLLFIPIRAVVKSSHGKSTKSSAGAKLDKREF